MDFNELWKKINEHVSQKKLVLQSNALQSDAIQKLFDAYLEKNKKKI